MSTYTGTMDVPRENVSPLMILPAAVGFYFSFRLSITYLLFQATPQTGAAVSIALNLLVFVVVVFHSLGPAPTTLASALRVSCLRWVMLFLGFSLASLLWSATVSVAVALAYWCGMAADVAVVVLLLRTGPTEPVAAALMKGYVCG